MQFFKKLVPLTLLCSTISVHPRGMNARKSPGAIPKPVAVKPAANAQQPKQQPKTYAQALTAIRNETNSRTIIANNLLTQRFIDFVQSLNLSPVQKKALLEAGIHLHITLSNNDQTNEKISDSLTKQIQNVMNKQPIAQVKQPQPVAQPVTPIVQKKPAQPIMPIVPNKPASPIVKPNVPHVLKIGNTFITIVQGDITKQNIDAIVNAANENLLHGGGVAAAISQAAGPNLQAYSNNMPIISNGEKCPTGQAVITPAFDLENVGIKNIIHTAGPRGNNPNREQLLYDTYKNSLRVAKNNNLRSIAFPAISTDIFGYDINEATPIAFAAVRDFIKNNPRDFDHIRFILFSKDNMDVYKKWQNELLK